MKKQFNNAIKLLKELKINGCITGSCLLEYFPDADIDVFTYTEESFRELLYFMKYNPLFQILEPLEIYKEEEYLKRGKSSLQSIGLITIKYKYNLTVDVNVVYRKTNHNVFDVISNFDLSIICKGYDIKTGKILDLSEYKGDKKGTWNKWNRHFYQPDQWNVRRFCRQWQRVVKYEQRGYDLSSVTNKYIKLVEEVISKENIYKTERGTKFYEDTQEQFKIVLKILKAYRKEKKISPEALLILKSLI